MAPLNKKDLLVRNFKFLAEHYRSTEPFKARAYEKVIKMLPSEVFEQADVETIGGKSIQEKIGIMLNTNDDLPIYKELNTVSNTMSKHVNILSSIHGVGIVKATELVQNHSITSVEELKRFEHLLNDVQKKGLKYHFDIQKRIPRREMNKHHEYLEKCLNVDFVIAGSYRREQESSGDIDVLITGDENKLKEVVNRLSLSGYLMKDGIFACGDVKCMAMCKLPRHQTARRIDILFTPRNEYAFAQLYFTGNDTFNIEMRSFAAKKGYILNEKGLFDKTTGKNVTHEFNNERDIFDFLEYQYVVPASRNL